MTKTNHVELIGQIDGWEAVKVAARCGVPINRGEQVRASGMLNRRTGHTWIIFAISTPDGSLRLVKYG
jgi:hypothetical protein